jgi:hypothetical protein
MWKQNRKPETSSSGFDGLSVRRCRDSTHKAKTVHLLIMPAQCAFIGCVSGRTCAPLEPLGSVSAKNNPDLEVGVDARHSNI